ncbi:MAG: chorismate pyruvate-lyase family protein [Pseudomonadota bacterium]
MSQPGYTQSAFLSLPGAEEEINDKRKLWKTLSPFARALLSTDGSFTLLLQAFSDEAIEPVVLMQEIKTAELAGNTGQALKLQSGDQVLQRNVLLRAEQSKQNLVYATSCIAYERLLPEVRDQVLEGTKSIGLLLRSVQLESYRELINWGLCQSTDVAEMKGYFDSYNNYDMLYRTYRIVTKKLPLLIMSEYFPRHVFEEKQ